MYVCAYVPFLMMYKGACFVYFRHRHVEFFDTWVSFSHCRHKKNNKTTQIPWSNSVICNLKLFLKIGKMAEILVHSQCLDIGHDLDSLRHGDVVNSELSGFPCFLFADIRSHVRHGFWIVGHREYRICRRLICRCHMWHYICANAK